jgi:hypothetical protein
MAGGGQRRPAARWEGTTDTAIAGTRCGSHLGGVRDGFDPLDTRLALY